MFNLKNRNLVLLLLALLAGILLQSFIRPGGGG